MIRRIPLLLIGILLGGLSALPVAAQNAPPVGTATAGGLGTILVDQNGMTLYTLSADSAGVSTCSGPCATPWPPATIDAATAVQLAGGDPGGMGQLGTLTRADGSLQLTWN